MKQLRQKLGGGVRVPESQMFLAICCGLGEECSSSTGQTLNDRLRISDYFSIFEIPAILVYPRLASNPRLSKALGRKDCSGENLGMARNSNEERRAAEAS